MKAFIKIKEWGSFQSYKDRKPPWIRLHKSLLDNYEFHSMSVNARALLPMLWLLASEDDDPVSGSIRFGYKKIAFRLRDCEKNVISAVKEIEKANFIEINHSSDDLSDDLRKSYKNQSCNENVTKFRKSLTPETDTETETEKETHMRFCFEADWTKYPRKRGSKEKAWKEYKKTVANDLGANRPLFLKKMDQQIQFSTDIDFIPYGETFFRNWQGLEFDEADIKPETEDEKRDREIHELSLKKEREWNANN